MLTIRLFDHHIHRNETTFRPYVQARDLFKDVGIKFTFGDQCDLTWVGQATFSNRKYDYDRVMRYIYWKKEIRGDLMMFDGQDSPSLFGAYDMLMRDDPLIMVKNSLYADRIRYTEPSIHGRIWWGEATQHNYPADYNYHIDNPDFSKIRLSGTNWLSTVQPYWYDLTSLKKDIDVFAMFSYPAKVNTEFRKHTHQFYDAFRQKCIQYLDILPSSVKVAKLDNGQKVPIEQYYELMKRSKIVLAPFGYGEMAPRDLESAMVGAVLVKPDMSHIESIPNIYIPDVTYRPIRWDFSDMNDVIIDTLTDWSNLRDKFVTNLRNEYLDQYRQDKLVLHVYDIIKNLKGYGTT